MISVQNLSKYFGAVMAVDGVSFEIGQGEVVGFLGPNGAGKTTTVKILLGLTRATSGEARLFGIPVGDPESRRRVGYLPEGHRFPGYLTARETLAIFGRMSGVDGPTLRSRIGPLLDRVGLASWRDVRVKKFSKGMTQRLGLAAALVHDPQVLLLDEPTDGVDPVGRREIRDLLREEADRGRAILVNSHLLSEIERTCDRVAVLRAGRIAAQGTVAELTAQTARYRMTVSPIDDALLASLRETGSEVTRVNGHLELSARDLVQLNAAVDRVRARGALLEELSPLRASLEDVFVDLIAPTSAGGGPKEPS